MRKVTVLFLLLTVSCVSFNSKKEKELPKITDTMPLKDAIVNAVEFGGPTLSQVNKLIKKRKEWSKAEEYLYKILLTDNDITASSLINAMELFRASQSSRAPIIFKKFVNDSTLIKRQLAWQLAADAPSQAMGREVENHLTEAVAENELNLVYIPAMADAVAANRLVDSYTIVREGLYFSGDIAFARAMITLNPGQASIDFLEYLAKAPVEELRQMSLKSVDVYTCTLILEHFRAYQPPVSNPRIETLFFYSISRNNALAEMARDVFEKYLPKHSEAFALTLSRLPSWMQLAFVERSSKRLTPVISLFLDDLRKVSADKDVVDEISGLKI
jgi:hypothetical protein